MLILVILGVLLLKPFFFQKSEPKLSPDQQKVIDLIGEPDQFVVTYSEAGSYNDPKLIRNETWVYPKAGTKVTFLGGNLAYSDNYTSDNQEALTNYRPQDFEFDQDYKDITKIVGKDKLVQINDIPGITDTQDIQVYTTEEIMFVFENGFLVYVQTLIPVENAE